MKQLFEAAEKLGIDTSDLLPVVVDLADGDGLKPETKKYLLEKLVPALLIYVTQQVVQRAKYQEEANAPSTYDPDVDGKEESQFYGDDEDIKPPANVSVPPIEALELGVQWFAFKSKLYGRKTEKYQDVVAGREAINNRSSVKLDLTPIGADGYRYERDDTVKAGQSFKPVFYVWFGDEKSISDFGPDTRYTRFTSDTTKIVDRPDGGKGLEPTREDFAGGVQFSFGGKANFDSKGHSPRGRVFEEGTIKFQASLDGKLSNVVSFRVK